MRWFRNSRAPRAEGSHVRVAVFPVNNRPETVERFRPHVKVGSSHDAAVRRGALASDAFVALFTFQTAHVYSFPRRVFCARDFVPLLRSPGSRGGRSAERRSGAALSTRWACHSANALSPRHALAGPLPVFSCFFADSESSIPGLKISSTHTPPRSRGACLRPGGLHLCFAHPNRGGAERRETFGCVRSTRGACHLASKTRVNALMTRDAGL